MPTDCDFLAQQSSTFYSVDECLAVTVVFQLHIPFNTVLLSIQGRMPTVLLCTSLPHSVQFTVEWLAGSSFRWIIISHQCVKSPSSIFRCQIFISKTMFHVSSQFSHYSSSLKKVTRKSWWRLKLLLQNHLQVRRFSLFFFVFPRCSDSLSQKRAFMGRPVVHQQILGKSRHEKNIHVLRLPD